MSDAFRIVYYNVIYIFCALKDTSLWAKRDSGELHCPATALTRFVI